jgi:hypothetical protein
MWLRVIYQQGKYCDKLQSLLCMLDEIKAKGIVDKPDRKIII